MQRTQIYLTEEQRRLLDRRARDAGVPMAEVLRRILDEGLGIRDARDDRVRAVDESAGALADDETWQEFLERVRRPGGADARLSDLGL
jgi:hypothetical protein